MAEVTASMVKELRDKSGAGMMDCKKALAETSGDMEAAVDWLRTKGLATASKKSSRTGSIMPAGKMSTIPPRIEYSPGSRTVDARLYPLMSR